MVNLVHLNMHILAIFPLFLKGKMPKSVYLRVPNSPLGILTYHGSLLGYPEKPQNRKQKKSLLCRDRFLEDERVVASNLFLFLKSSISPSF